MELFTKEIILRLDENGRISHPIAGHFEPSDLKPVVKLFSPDAHATWLIVSTDPHHPDQAFGLCDLGFGIPELGEVSIDELRSFRGVLGFHLERDPYFKPRKTLGEYAEQANRLGKITT